MASKKQEEAKSEILDIIDEQIKLLSSDKTLGYKPVNLERGSYVSGTLSCGSFIIDLITGGGIPPGKWTTVFGPEGSGKSTLTGHAMAYAQENEVPIILYDHEASNDPIYMRNLGIRFRNPDGTLNRYFKYFQPENGESTYRHMHRMLSALPDFKAATDGSRPKPTLLMVIDSLDAMVSEKLMADDENGQNGMQASMHGNGMRLNKTLLGRKNVTVLSTNQLKLNPRQMFGNPEYEPGGQAVKFYPDLKMRMSAVGKVWNERGRDIRNINIRTIKNKQFVPFRVTSDKIKTSPCVAFGVGFERGYDGYGYLLLTDQISKVHGGWQFNIPDTYLHGQKMKWNDLMITFHTNKFRDLIKEQILCGYAFEKYFDHEKLEVHEYNSEDSGVKDASESEEAGPNEGSEDGGDGDFDPDGEIKMKPNKKVLA